MSSNAFTADDLQNLSFLSHLRKERSLLQDACSDPN
jgi:hypothetical protein